ncbi:MAG: GIY-YIG nuclease family protein [Deltaproteobacteria bacterium]
MYFFYVLYSLKDHRLYKGVTMDVNKRLEEHNSGRTKSTKSRRPFVLLYFEEYPEKTLALKRENWAKTLDGGSQLKLKLIELGLLTVNGIIKRKDSE